MNIKPFKGNYVDLSMVASPDSFFASVKAEYQSLKESGFFDAAQQESLYLYEIQRGEKHHLGVLACVDIKEYEAGKILKHEHTLAEKEQTMMNLVFQRRAIIKPILLTYPPYEPMKSWMHTYKNEHDPFFVVHLEEHGEQHSLWNIEDPDTIDRFRVAFKDKIGKAYIADGHHRSSTTYYLHHTGQGSKHGLNFEQLFAAFFDFDELEVYDYNRLVDVFQDMTPSRFMAEISNYCDITYLGAVQKPTKKHEMTMCLRGEWYSLQWRKKVIDQYSEEMVILDTQLLDDLIFQNVLGIKDVRTDSRLSYVEGVKSADFIHQKVHKKPDTIGFCLYPVALEDVIRIAETDNVMPPKSTWFEPRIRNGMLVLDL